MPNAQKCSQHSVKRWVGSANTSPACFSHANRFHLSNGFLIAKCCLGTIVEFVSSWPNDSGANPRFFWGPAGFWSLWKRNLRHCPPLSWRIRPEAFVLREISSTTFLQQTLVLPPNSFLIEMQMHLSGWLHFPYSNWRMQLYPEFVDFPTSDFSCQYLDDWPEPAHSCWSQKFFGHSRRFYLCA